MDKQKVIVYVDGDESFPKLKEMTYKILQQHNTMKGIIQTGSYENAKKLWMEAPPNVRSRLLLYENSKEKEQLINKHKESFNTVLWINRKLLSMLMGLTSIMV